MGVGGPYHDGLRPFQAVEAGYQWHTGFLRRLVGKKKDPVVLALADGLRQRLFQTVGNNHFLWTHATVDVLNSVQRYTNYSEIVYKMVNNCRFDPFFFKSIKLFFTGCVKNTKFTIKTINEKITRYFFSVGFDHDGIRPRHSQRYCD